jgi:AcrR family transcriptional regulator
MPSSTRHRLIVAATSRFYRDGFRNVGLDQILADVGISKTAFYKHFESKDDLLLAALETKNLWLQEFFRQMVEKRGGLCPADRLRALFDIVEQVIGSDEFHGCIFVNVSMEFPLLHEPAHIAAAKHKQQIEQIVRELAAEAGAREPEVLARQLCLIMEGAYVTRHVTGDATAIESARRVAELAIAAQVAGAAVP